MKIWKLIGAIVVVSSAAAIVTKVIANKKAKKFMEGIE